MFSKLSIIGSAALLLASALPSLAQDDPWKPVYLQDGRITMLGEYAIENRTIAKRDAVQTVKKLDYWRYFMQGRLDSKATVVPWQLLDENNTLKPYYDSKAIVDNVCKKSTLPALKLLGGKSLTLPRPLLSGEDAYALRGNVIRIFIWMKGDKTGQGTDLWSGAPSVTATFLGVDNFVVDKSTSMFKTRGTFPWFCYFLDVTVPASMPKPIAATEQAEQAETQQPETTPADGKTPGLYLTLNNPASGTAWFSTLGWMKITAAEMMNNQSTIPERLDPVTGSLAPNPDYDELPMHFFFGMSDDVPWTFFKGTQTLPNLTKNTELEKYIDKYHNDWGHALHAISTLATAYSNGMLLKTMPEFQQDWDLTLARKLYQYQDAKTGFWHIDGAPNLLVTAQIIFNSFSPESISHPDMAPVPTPWMSIKDSPLEKADQIIDTIAKAQQKDKNGELAAWNDFSFRPELKTAPGANSPCDIMTSAHALKLLCIAKKYASPEKTTVADKAINAAYNFVISKMFITGGLWKRNAMDNGSSSPSHMFTFLNASPWMEVRLGKSLLPPKVTTAVENDVEFTGSWKREAPYVSLRIYAAPADLQVTDLTEKHVVAIIQPSKNANVMEMDPLIALKTMTAKAKQYWGITPGMEAASYLEMKLANINTKLFYTHKTKNIKFQFQKTKLKQAIHICGVTAYGELSPFETLPETIPARELTDEELAAELAAEEAAAAGTSNETTEADTIPETNADSVKPAATQENPAQ